MFSSSLLPYKHKFFALWRYFRSSSQDLDLEEENSRENGAAPLVVTEAEDAFVKKDDAFPLMRPEVLRDVRIHDDVEQRKAGGVVAELRK